MQTITEGKATIFVSEEKKISKDLEVFYNPVMQFNRDMSIALLKAINLKNMRIADPLAGSGVRAIRFLKELPPQMIEEIAINDRKEGFSKIIKKNLKISKCKEGKITIHEQDANLFLLTQPSFDYVDIDPFGSPNQFLDAAIKKTRRKGILAITATDTAPLCGTYPKACARKYWGKPRRDHLMHEYGLRILIRKCQLVAAQYDKAITPIFSYSKHHYFRVFFEVIVGKKKVNDILKQQETINGYGPLWTGQLWEEKIVKKMLTQTEEKYQSFLEIIHAESKIKNVGFFDVHVLAKELKLTGPPKTETLFKKLKKKKYQCSRTHFTPIGIKTNASEKVIKKIIKEEAT